MTTSTPLRPLRIAVADEPAACEAYRAVLGPLGHEVVAPGFNGRQLVSHCRSTRPDLVIAEFRLPELDAIAASGEVCPEWDVPFILVSADNTAEPLARVGADHVMAFLTKPVRPHDLIAAVHIAVLRFGHYRQARAEAASLRQALEDRKVIEQAKGAVMAKAGVTEPEAFRRLQELARGKSLKMVEVARAVLGVEQLFDPQPPAAFHAQERPPVKPGRIAWERGRGHDRSARLVDNGAG